MLGTVGLYVKKGFINENSNVSTNVTSKKANQLSGRECSDEN
jgi:hypothetical protein